MSTQSFRPLPFLSNPHVQTVLGSMLRGTRFHAPTRLRAVPLPDGDHLAILDSIPPMWKPGDPIVVIVHGMGGSAKSAFVQRTARRYWKAGMRAVRVDLRGSGAGVAWARGIYNAGVSADIRSVMGMLERESPSSPVLLVGFSLGGNISLKLAGEVNEHPVPNLAKVIAVAPPIDLQSCSSLIALRRNRIYDRKFTRNLLELANEHHQHHPDLPLPNFPKKLTVRQFDDLYTSPRAGFQNADDYYRRSSSAPLIANINVPTLILTARDDPFIPAEPFERLAPNDFVRVVITKHGGHLGFLGADGEGGSRWAEQQIAEWGCRHG